MPQASHESIDHFPAFLARLPAGLDLEALARGTRAFRRARGVRSGTDLLRLALAWGCGGYSMQRVVAWAGEQGIATLTDEALSQRLHGAVGFLEAVTGQLLAHTGALPSWHGRVFRVAERHGDRRCKRHDRHFRTSPSLLSRGARRVEMDLSENVDHAVYSDDRHAVRIVGYLSAFSFVRSILISADATWDGFTLGNWLKSQARTCHPGSSSQHT